MSFGKRPPCCLKIQNEKAHNEEPDVSHDVLFY